MFYIRDGRRAIADHGRMTGTIVTRSLSPLKSSGLEVYTGNWFAIAVDAIIRSAIRPRGLRPAISTAAATRPNARAAAASKGSGSKVASACWSTLMRRARSAGPSARCGPVESSAKVTALITISVGKSAGLSAGSRMTMLVSIRPRSLASPLMAEGVLVRDGLNIRPELLGIKDRRSGERRHDLLARNEDASA